MDMPEVMQSHAVETGLFAHPREPLGDRVGMPSCQESSTEFLVACLVGIHCACKRLKEMPIYQVFLRAQKGN